LAGLLGLALFAGQAVAAEWSIEPRVGVNAFYDDNFLLRTIGAKSESAVVISPAAKFSRKTETTGISIDTRFDFYRFPGSDTLNTNDANLQFSGSTRTERSQWQLDVGFKRDSTITSELEDSGRVDIRRRRELKSFSPSWSYLLSETSRLQLGWTYNQADYDALPSEFLDYRYNVLSANWFRQLDERNQLQVSFSRTVYEVDDINFKSTTNGIQAGLIRNFSPLLTGTILLGGRRTDSNGSSNNGALVLISAVYKGERLKLDASLSRDVQPSSLGQLNQSDRLSFSAKYSFDEKHHIEGHVSLGRNRNTGNGSTANDRNYTRLSLVDFKRFSPHWWLRLEYAYRQQKYIESSLDGKSNRISVGVEYRFDKRAISR
jgi:hypothetical protein